MENKVLIKLVVPIINDSFNLFLPVNEIVWKIKKMVIKSVVDLTGISLNESDNYILLNKDNCRVYRNNEIIIDTDIRNGTELLIYSVK